MMAKRFFHVSAGIFLLLAAYALGAVSVAAQSGSILDGARVVDVNLGSACAAVGRQLYFLSNTHGQVLPVGAPVPGNSRIVATYANGGDLMAILENGEVWVFDVMGTASWHLGGTFPVAGATQGTKVTLGAIKARYR